MKEPTRLAMPLAIDDAWFAAGAARFGIPEHELRRAVTLEGEELERWYQDVARASREERLALVAKTREQLVAAGVQDLHLEHVYDVPPLDSEPLRHVKAFRAERSVFLVLSGGVGTGKTAAAIWAMAQHAGSQRFLSATVLSSIMAKDDSEEEKERRRVLFTSELLVLDDLGAEYEDPKGFSVQVFNALLDVRYGFRRRTIITTNLDPVQFMKRYGARALDRIRETGRFEECKGQNMRRGVVTAQLSEPDVKCLPPKT